MDEEKKGGDSLNSCEAYNSTYIPYAVHYDGTSTGYYAVSYTTCYPIWYIMECIFEEIW
jgi:hypothetical protein